MLMGQRGDGKPGRKLSDSEGRGKNNRWMMRENGKEGQDMERTS